MANLNELAQQNLAASEAVGSDAIPFNQMAADLLLRNLAVATDRLKPYQFYNQLSPQTEATARHVALIANEIVPIAAADAVRLSHETEADYKYRLEVWHPLHRLQAKLYANAVEPNNTAEVNKIKAVVSIGGLAFAGLMRDAHNIHSIRATEGYFWGNTNAATGTVDRLRAEAIDRANRD